MRSFEQFICYLEMFIHKWWSLWCTGWLIIRTLLRHQKLYNDLLALCRSSSFDLLNFIYTTTMMIMINMMNAPSIYNICIYVYSNMIVLWYKANIKDICESLQLKRLLNWQNGEMGFERDRKHESTNYLWNELNANICLYDDFGYKTGVENREKSFKYGIFDRMDSSDSEINLTFERNRSLLLGKLSIPNVTKIISNEWIWMIKETLPNKDKSKVLKDEYERFHRERERERYEIVWINFFSTKLRWKLDLGIIPITKMKMAQLKTQE